jgi:hypothetical protein
MRLIPMRKNEMGSYTTNDGCACLQGAGSPGQSAQGGPGAWLQQAAQAGGVSAAALAQQAAAQQQQQQQQQQQPMQPQPTQSQQQQQQQQQPAEEPLDTAMMEAVVSALPGSGDCKFTTLPSCICCQTHVRTAMQLCAASARDPSHQAHDHVFARAAPLLRDARCGTASTTTL